MRRVRQPRPDFDDRASGRRKNKSAAETTPKSRTENPLIAPIVCRVCGRALEPYRGRGRPAEFCRAAKGQERSACARVATRFREIDSLSSDIVKDIEATGGDTEDARRSLQAIKAFLWSQANQATNKGKLVRTTEEKYRKKRSGWHRLA